jgi:hypothetical protein
VLQLGDELDLVLELNETLPGLRRQPLHRNLGSIRQHALKKNAEINISFNHISENS